MEQIKDKKIFNMDEVSNWYQEIEEKINGLDDLFPEDERETSYFENYHSGMEHYFHRIGNVDEEYWEEEFWDEKIAERFNVLWNYLANYWNSLNDTDDLDKAQFRMLTSVSRIAGVKILSDRILVLVVDGWDQEIIDELSKAWEGRMFSTTEDERGIATWYSFKLDKEWMEKDYSESD